MPVTTSTNSAHDATNPRERISDVTATGRNTIASNHPIVPEDPPISRLLFRPAQPLSNNLPPLIFGTATFNYQFNPDPYALSPDHIVHAALSRGIRAFDTSPYYGPAESILGSALHSGLITTDHNLRHLRRSDYYILTKAGRVAGDKFDYSPAWIRHSVKRSLHRLKTTYLDVVYLHDVEFVSPAEVLEGIRVLRSIRDETGTLRYAGICGYPVDTLCSLAEMILAETGEPVNIVQSYANYTIQNQLLLTHGLQRLKAAAVDVVPNASPLGMGLCRSQGVPIGSMGNWHPAPDGLRAVCLTAAQWLDKEHSEKLETVAVRFAMEGWLTAGKDVGSCGITPADAAMTLSRRNTAESAVNDNSSVSRPRLGVSVMGVSKLSELEDTMTVYNNILASHQHPADARIEQIRQFTDYIRDEILGKEWTDFTWSSPDPGFVNQRKTFGPSEDEQRELEKHITNQSGFHQSSNNFTSIVAADEKPTQGQSLDVTGINVGTHA